jgi:ankyrin repeat protein
MSELVTSIQSNNPLHTKMSPNHNLNINYDQIIINCATCDSVDHLISLLKLLDREREYPALHRILNKRNQLRYTPLHEAIFMKSMEYVKILVNYGNNDHQILFFLLIYEDFDVSIDL